MALKPKRYRAGLTFVEILIATVILLIAVIGTSAFRYNAALGARKADLRTAASRTALLLCEAWRGVSDPNAFDPVATFGSELVISSLGQGVAGPDGFTVHGAYEITNEGAEYYAVLSWKDVSAGLRALNVVVTWNQRGYSSDDGGRPDKSFALTTYVAD